MKLIIAGSRNIFDESIFSDALYALAGEINALELGHVTEVVSGGCKGIDRMGEEWASIYCLELKRFPADWDKHGKAAGPIRNRQMAGYGDALLLIWDGKSRGSASMKREMEKLKKPVFEYIV